MKTLIFFKIGSTIQATPTYFHFKFKRGQQHQLFFQLVSNKKKFRFAFIHQSKYHALVNGHFVCKFFERTHRTSSSALKMTTNFHMQKL